MPQDEYQKRTILLVHGAWHGTWTWARFTPELARLGWHVETVQLPSASADLNNSAGMYDDAREIRARIDAIAGPVTVLAHSYGGIPATQAAAGAPNVERLVYVSAFQVEQGDSLASLSGGQLPAVDTGTLAPNDDPQQYFYTDVPSEIANAAAGRLVPQSLRSFSEPLTEAAWKTIPSTYILCEKDQAIPLGFQEAMATRSARTYRLPSSHSPFLSMPEELAKIVTEDAAA